MEPVYHEALGRRGQELALAFDDPAAIAVRLAEWAKANLPERVSSALWITAQQERDKGVEILLHELTLGQRIKVRLGALVGAWSAGVNASVPLGRIAGRATVSVGLGAVVRYADLDRIEPVATFTFRF
jgi:hypothetical protein